MSTGMTSNHRVAIGGNKAVLSTVCPVWRVVPLLVVLPATALALEGVPPAEGADGRGAHYTVLDAGMGVDTSNWDPPQEGSGSGPVAGRASGSAARRGPQGIAVGIFRLHPEVTPSLRWEDNVYKTATNTRSDVMEQLKTVLKLLTHWARNQVDVTYSNTIKHYQVLETEDNIDHQLDMQAKLAPSRRLELDLGYLAAIEHDERGVPGKATVKSGGATVPVGPNAWLQNTAKGTARWKMRRLTSELKLEHGDRLSLNNNQSSQDRDWNDGGVTFKWSLTPKTHLLTEMGYKATHYEHSPQLSSTESRFLVGAGWKATARTESNTKIGVTKKVLENAPNKDNLNLTWESGFVWQPQVRTRINFTSHRNFQESEDQNEGFISTGFQLGLNHALRPGWRLLAGLELNTSTFETAKQENYWTSRLGMEYKLPEWFTLNTEFIHKIKRSTVLDAGYDSNALMLSVTGTF
ncbi:MAG: outer membrane beta-barrel protein [Magnetococcales bacterium]|nr:outer membrane beta-barrel protein [Magnetococcales bacterium]